MSWAAIGNVNAALLFLEMRTMYREELPRNAACGINASSQSPAKLSLTQVFHAGSDLTQGLETVAAPERQRY